MNKISSKLLILVLPLFFLGCTTLRYQSQYQELDSLHASGQITEDEYRWRYSMLKEEELAERDRKIQMFGLIQNRQYQRKSLQLQQQKNNTDYNVKLHPDGYGGYRGEIEKK